MTETGGPPSPANRQSSALPCGSASISKTRAPSPGKRRCNVNSKGGLAHAAFLVEKSKDHQNFLISGFVNLRLIVKADFRQVNPLSRLLCCFTFPGLDHRTATEFLMLRWENSFLPCINKGGQCIQTLPFRRIRRCVHQPFNFLNRRLIVFPGFDWFLSISGIFSHLQRQYDFNVNRVLVFYDSLYAASCCTGYSPMTR